VEKKTNMRGTKLTVWKEKRDINSQDMVMFIRLTKNDYFVVLANLKSWESYKVSFLTTLG
jgi:hypothetical protein